jgi:hypothetical protein
MTGRATGRQTKEQSYGIGRKGVKLKATCCMFVIHICVDKIPALVAIDLSLIQLCWKPAISSGKPVEPKTRTRSR